MQLLKNCFCLETLLTFRVLLHQLQELCIIVRRVSSVFLQEGFDIMKRNVADEANERCLLDGGDA